MVPSAHDPYGDRRTGLHPNDEETQMRKLHRAAASMAAATLLLAIAGCGSDSDGGATAATDAPTKTPPVVDITASGGDGKWAFELPSEGVPGGVVTLRLKNDSTDDTHDFQLVRVDGNHTAAEVQELVSSEDSAVPTWMHGAGGVGTVAPGGTGEVTMDLPAGHYFYFCNDESDGKKHGPNGMFGELDVKGKSGASLPTATAHLSALEYKFTTSGLKAGKNVVEFSNTGKEVHMVLAAPIAEGKTIEDVKASFTSQEESQGPPPVDFEKAVSTEVIDPGVRLITTWDLAPGKYAFICFMTDHAGGPPHFMSGMLQEVDVS
jgi:uncharacterized cupredoxin-like copper-binding protein